MKVTITSLKLRRLYHFFPLSWFASRILRQISKAPCLKIKTTGFWKMHYTMTLWPDEKSLKEFARTGQHLEAMKKSAAIAEEISTLTIDSVTLPNWTTAKKILLEQGKVITFK